MVAFSRQQQQKTIQRLIGSSLGAIACSVGLGELAAIAQARPLPLELAAPLSSTTVRVFVNGVQQETLPIVLQAGSPPQVKFPVAPLLALLDSDLPSGVSVRLSQAAQARDGILTPSDLQQQGMEVAFSQEFLELHIQAEDRPPAESSIAIADGSIAARLESSSPLRVSASDRGARLDRLPNGLSLTGNLRLATGWHLVAGGSLQAGNKSPWQRNSLQLVRTDVERSVTYTVGEFSVSDTGYQSRLALLGLRATSGTSNHPSTSQLEIAADGKPLQTLKIPDAIASSADSPDRSDLAVPSNLADSSDPLSESTAPIGEYAYAIGVLWPIPAREKPAKVEDRLVLSLSNRWNASDTLAAEAYVQATTLQQVIGTGASWATPAGELDWDIAASQAAVADPGVAAELQYRPSLPISESSLQLSAAYRDARFLTLGENTPLDDPRWTLSATYDQQWFNGFETNLFGTYRLRDGQIPESFRMGLRVSTSLTESLGLTIDLAQTERSNHPTSRQATLRLYLR
ncbi:hypothetical protein [Synechococcus sp. PCC 7336]|uniref:hypothetical protein n=1 Tax=Synechococcus sp. PCC 7336 TaxID=195250 RepID=UPI00034AF67C|nr:hypothetical protein [Synechococcus sp. PCC 7336]